MLQWVRQPLPCLPTGTGSQMFWICFASSWWISGQARAGLFEGDWCGAGCRTGTSLLLPGGAAPGHRPAATGAWAGLCPCLVLTPGDLILSVQSGAWRGLRYAAWACRGCNWGLKKIKGRAKSCGCARRFTHRSSCFWWHHC